MRIDPSAVLDSPDFCVRRGYHGPFSNAAKYDLLPEWRGLADCAVCGSTCHVARQQELERLIQGMLATDTLVA